MNVNDNSPSDEELWNARTKALQVLLGPSDNLILHSPLPFFLGGGADVISFRHYVNGVTYVTADVSGEETAQIPNGSGNYELMICMKNEDARASSLISQLAQYSCDECLSVGETMDCDWFSESNVVGFLFVQPETTPSQFELYNRYFSLLLCVGITQAELEECQRGNSDLVLQKLKQSKVFPFTDLHRASVI